MLKSMFINLFLTIIMLVTFSTDFEQVNKKIKDSLKLKDFEFVDLIDIPPKYIDLPYLVWKMFDDTSSLSKIDDEGDPNINQKEAKQALASMYFSSAYVSIDPNHYDLFFNTNWNHLKLMPSYHGSNYF